jgi:hypothetical protein
MLVRQAREAAEEALGERVVSSQNFLHLKQVKGSKAKKTLPRSSQTQPTLFDEGDHSIRSDSPFLTRKGSLSATIREKTS